MNAKGSTPVEIMGIDYKTKIKPALDSFGEDIKKNSMDKLEELITLQQQSSEVAAKVEGKRNHIAKLQSHINDVSSPKLYIDYIIQHDYDRCTLFFLGVSEYFFGVLCSILIYCIAAATSLLLQLTTCSSSIYCNIVLGASFLFDFPSYLFSFPFCCN